MTPVKKWPRSLRVLLVIAQIVLLAQLVFDSFNRII